ncbi:transmembrane protein, putative (macronuclear) [Tetrahymena thermophila SB210]|uniref:Transmembrane protein, putative n=1 Tax=Tetrahymena thermophila (strain SB210) TaxID=312017 RepID=I7LVE6_TETTS|nr:transmembrane protein, putative [Tetrahymena thermophila SB210]EAR97980.2 transmembrane protein, putative [Tetrahymena thermophila SB210]|eukprot:XP_001018225.2 transmembrane protein, putative [Tetrahymena thermophila SB210]
MQQSISSMDTNDNNNLATFCSANGQIMTWEYSTLLQPNLVDSTFITNFGSCNTIKFLYNSTALILFQNSILAIDVIQFKILNTWNFINPSSKMVNRFILAYNGNSFLLFDSCFYVFDTNFQQIFNDCSQLFDDVIVQANLDKSLYLVIQKIYSISVVFVDLAQQQLVFKGDYKSLAQIQYMKIRSFPESYPQQSNTIFEILVYFSNFTFTIFNQQLSVIASFQNIQLSQVVDISFVTSDPNDNIYVVGGITSQKSATFKYQAFALLKNETGIFQVIAASKINKLFPVYKSVNPANLAIGYTFKICFFQGIFTNIQDYYFNMGNQANFIQEAGGSQNVLMNTFQLIKSDQFYFYGDQSGQITLDITRRQFNQNVFELNAEQKQQNDFIQGVYQSLLLQKYFIVKSNILVYDLLTDQYIEQIDIQSSSKIYSFQILEQQQSIIFIQGNTLFYKNYQTNKLYSYSNLSIVTNYLLDNNNIYLYGISIVKLNFDMTVKLLINSNSDIIQSCQLASLILACKYPSGILNIFDKSNFNHVTSIQQHFIDSGYFFQIDELFQRIILYSQNIEVYNFAGFLELYINTINSPIQDLQILQNDISAQLTIYINVYDRASFNYRGQVAGAGGGNIISQQYVPPLNQILFYSSTLRFAQFFAFNLDTLQIVVSYKSALNTPSSTVAYQYDKDQGIYILLDSGGNFYFINYQIQQIQLARLIEYDQNSNYQILGFSINYENNNVFIYSQTQVFNLYLAELNNQARKYIVNKKQLFTKITTNSDANTNQNGFIIAGDQGLLYKYQNSAFENFYQFDQEIQEVVYNQNMKLLIIALTDRFIVFQNFNSNSLSVLNPWSQNSLQEITISGMFQQFICQDIYMTKDRQIYHYDFVNQAILGKISFQDSSTLILQKICSVNKPYLYLGSNIGNVLIYNQNTQNQVIINLLENQMENRQNDVQIGKFVETTTDLWVCFSSSVGIFKISLLDFSFKQIVQFSSLTTYKYIQYLNILIFDIDKQYNRVFLSFIGEKLMRVFDLSGNIISLVSLPGRTYNNLQINPSHLLAYTCFHIMIYDRQTLQYIQRIRRDNVYDFITDIIEIESQYILLVTYTKYELFKIQTKAIEALLMDQIQLQYPSFMGYEISYGQQQNNILGLSVILLSSNQIQEQRYNLVYENIQDQNKICSIDISVSTFQDVSFSINIIKTVSFPDSSQRLMIPVQDPSLNNYWNVQLVNSDLRNIDFKSTANSLVQVYSDKNLTNSKALNPIKIYNDSFLWYTKEELQMRDFSFIFEDQVGEINFNNQSLSVKYNNIQIQSQNLSNTTLLFTNMSNVVINGLYLTNLQRYLTQSNESDALMYFLNVTNVNIYNLTLDNNQMKNSSFYGLISAKNIQNFILSNLIIQNAEITHLFEFIQVQNLTINNLQINNCFYSQTNVDKHIINIVGVVNSMLSDILMSYNVNLLFIKTSNIYEDKGINYSLSTDTLNITNLKLQQNNITDSDSQSLVNIQCSFCYLENITFSKNQGNLKILQSQYLNISNSLFEYNQCLNGGALAIISSINQVKIYKSQFIHNLAFASGGAIYLENTNASIHMDAQVVITQNKALIGGGIRLYNNQLNYPQEIQKNYKNFIFGNEADLYGNNFATFLQKAIIGVFQEELNKQNGDSENIIEYKITAFEDMNLADQKQYQQILEIFNFQSGGLINLFIKLIDSEGTYLNFSFDSFYYQKYPQSIINELQFYQFKLQSQTLNQQVLINGPNVVTSFDYNDENKQFIFQQIQITSIPNQTTYLIIQPNYTSTDINVLPIQIKFNMRLCQIGEVIKQIEANIFSCYSCPLGSYSLIDTAQDLILINQILNQQGNTKESQNKQIALHDCQKCPQQALSCQNSTIFLKSGYWRINNTSTEIVECTLPFNACDQQDQTSRNGCIRGYKGPICRVCDLTGEVWDGKRYIEQFSNEQICVECGNVNSQIVFLFFTYLFLMIYIIINVLLIFNSLIYFSTCYYIRKMGILPISRNCIRDPSSFYLKILINYIQISSFLTNFSISPFPNMVLFVSEFLGNANTQVIIKCHCLISQELIKKYGLAHINQILEASLPVLTLIILLIILNIFRKFNIFKVKRFHQFTLVNFIFVFFQPNQIKFFTKQLSCTKIGSQNYVSSDLTISCGDLDYKNFTYIVSIPLLIIWITYPLVIFKLLQKRSKQLQTCYTLYYFGYYYQEYRDMFYYWEFIRIYLRIIVAVVITLSTYSNFINYQIVIMILIVYLKLMLTRNPIRNNWLQKLELQTNMILILICFLQSINMFLYSDIIQHIQYFIHYFVIFIIILFIVLYKISNSRTIIGKCFGQFLHYILPQSWYNSYKKQFGVTNWNVYKLWILVKKNLNVLVKFQALQKIVDEDQSKQLNDQTQDPNNIQNSSSLFQKISLINQVQRQLQTEFSKFKSGIQQYKSFQLQNSVNQTYIKDEIITKSKEKQELSDIFFCEQTSQYAGEINESQGTLQFYVNNNQRLEQIYQTEFKLKKNLDQLQLTFRNNDIN